MLLATHSIIFLVHIQYVRFVCLELELQYAIDTFKISSLSSRLTSLDTVLRSFIGIFSNLSVENYDLSLTVNINLIG